MTASSDFSRIAAGTSSMRVIEISNDEFSLLKAYLHETCGIDIPEEKSYLFKNRLNQHLHDRDYHSFSEFYHCRIEDEKLFQQLIIDSMTTNETSFFRDKVLFDAFCPEILDPLARQKIADSVYMPPLIRIWSAGCSSGQEPYSFAMLISEWLMGQIAFNMDTVAILATDISSRVLDKAATGIYTESEVSGIPDHMKCKHLIKTGDQWKISDKIKRLACFTRKNLVEDTADLGKFDIILCRNVIIYFPLPLKQSIVARFHSHLNPGGLLILGSSESLYGISEDFESKNIRGTLVYSKKQNQGLQALKKTAAAGSISGTDSRGAAF